MRQIGVGQFLQRGRAFGSLNRDLRVGVAQVLDGAIELPGVLDHPVHVFFTRAGINDQKVVSLSHLVDDDVIHKRTLGIEHGRVLALTNGQLRRVIHGYVLDGRQGLWTMNPDVAHVTDIKDTYAGADSEMFFHQTAVLGVLDRHIPAAEIDHFRPQLAVDSVQGCLADSRGGLGLGSQNTSLRRTIGATQDGVTKYGNTRFFTRSTIETV